MKKIILFAAVCMMPLSMMAQDDDMYFVPSKKNVAKERARYERYNEVYYSGSDRSVDDYNRRGSYYEPIAGDSSMTDVINFSAVEGVYPDSTADFQLTKKMARWDGYTPTDAYWEGYDQGRLLVLARPLVLPFVVVLQLVRSLVLQTLPLLWRLLLWWLCLQALPLCGWTYRRLRRSFEPRDVW